LKDRIRPDACDESLYRNQACDFTTP